LDKGALASQKKPFPPALKYGIIVFAAVAVIAVALIIWFSVQSSYVAAVDGEKIGTGEFKYYLEYQKSSMLGEAQAADPNVTEATFWKTNISGKNAFEVAKEKTLDSLREIKIQLVKAKESGTKLEASDKTYIDSLVKQIVDQYGSNIKANTALKKEGLSLEDFRKMYENLILTQKYREVEYGKFKVAEADIKTYYEKNPDWYKESEYRTKGEEAVWARHILIQIASDATQETKDAAKKKAQELLDKAKAGEDFAKLAKENTEDTGSKENGGEYLFGVNASFMQEFKDAAFKLSPGGISDLVQTSYGYHIIKVEEKYAKDEPASLKCAAEYNEYGLDYIKYQLYKEKLEGWKKDSKFDAVKNLSVYNSIKYQ
jgi:foldase protein PrsA